MAKKRKKKKSSGGSASDRVRRLERAGWPSDEARRYVFGGMRHHRFKKGQPHPWRKPKKYKPKR